MTDYISRKKTGGQYTSKIDNQDSVAAIYALELLSNPNIFNFDISINDFCIKCEGDNDIEIIDENYHIFIQVKSSKIDSNEFKKIMDDFLDNHNSEPEKECYYVISAFEPIKVGKKDFSNDQNNYIEFYNNKFETDKRKVEEKQKLLSKFTLDKYESLIDRLYIDMRPLFRDNKDTKAIFSRYLRLAYGFKDHRERNIDKLFLLLTDIFAQLRRSRGYIYRTKIENILSKELCKFTHFSGFAVATGYCRTEDGYVKDSKLISKRNLIALGCKKATKTILHNWRKTFFKEFLTSCLIGSKRCPKCGHPMIANFCGLTGISCPDCGYTPYVTLILFCECGDFEVIKTQPQLTDDKIFNYINNFFNKKNDSRCKSCNKDLLDDYIESRIMLLPIPIPYDEYKNIDSIYKNSIY